MTALATGTIAKDHCPCCGRAHDFIKPVVSLDFNSISYRNATVFVSPVLAEMAHVLVSHMPRIARREFMVEKVWGGLSDPEDKRISLDVHIGRLRRACAEIGLKIDTTWGVGWRMRGESDVLVRADRR